MREQLEARLTELEQEFEVGERRLRNVELEQTRLRETLLRMSGAIQVLRELLEPEETTDDSQPLPSESTSTNGRAEAAAMASP